MSSFDAEISVLQPNVSTPSPEALAAGVAPHLAVTIKRVTGA